MRFRTFLLISAALPVAVAQAGPQGGTVVGGGSATIQGQGTANVTVNQFSQNAIINWNTFNIGQGERTQFVQPNSASVVLNRVTGREGPSQILGTIDANGRVFLVNRDGVIFGAGAVINTAGFLATTSDIKNDDFMAGRYNFSIPGRLDASIVNQGRITAASGGFAALVAPGVRNSGTITANLGTVVLGAGNTFTANLDFYGDRLITLGVGDAIAAQVKDVATGQPLKALITNDGKLKANGGRVELTAAAARTVVDAVINTSGVIEANSVGMRNGQIVLSAATAGTKGNGAPTQTVRISGKLSAAGRRAGTKGGKIVVTGENIVVANATINAAGRDGGGTVMIGGDWGGGNPDKSLATNQSAVLDGQAIAHASTVSIDANSHIDASAKDRGDGGKVILWSDQYTSFAGTIVALGGQEFGNGGFVETSSHGQLNVSGTVNAGRGGAWLLDPTDLTVDTTLAASIQASLNGGTNVTEQTGTTGRGNGDIIFNSGVRIVWNTSATLTLIAFRNITFNDGGSGPEGPGNIVSTGAGNLVMRADSTGTGVGTIVLTPFTTPTRVNWTNSSGHIAAYYNPTVFGTQDNFTAGNGNFAIASNSQLTQYMLVNSVGNLQSIGTSGTTLAGTYALGKNIDASSIANFSPLGSFTGVLDGNGGLGTNYTISNLTIAPTTASQNNIGLFSSIASSGVVRNLNFAFATVTANPNVSGPGQFVGVLAGGNSGTISNVTVSNSAVTNGSAQSGVLAGGLVGQNQAGATIRNSGVDTVVVTVGDSTSGGQENNAAGLVAVNHGSVANATATNVIVFGGSHSELGGLVGRNEADGSIAGSSSSGTVAVNPLTGLGNVAGGLVGFNFGSIDSSSSSASVAGASSTISLSAMLGGLAGMNGTDTLTLHSGTITNSFATGMVIGGLGTTTGGFVGANTGNASIGNSYATGAVSSLDNFVGGFVGMNTGTIGGSHATGIVTGAGFGTGGFAGSNETDNSNGHIGSITNSYATGNVIDISTGNNGAAGGFVGQNAATISSSHASGNVFGGSTKAGGFSGGNDGSISNSSATGTVLVGDNATAGGFTAENKGQITASTATGQVGGGSAGLLGGFAGTDKGMIDSSSASGAVSSTGATSAVGGFVGASAGTISNSSSSGAVTGTSGSFLGGLVGVNFGLIQNASSSSPVTGTGAGNVAGGLVGFNFGVVDPSNPTGSVTSGPNSIVGGVVGANGALQFADGSQVIGTLNQPASPNPGPASGGSGSTTGSQVGQQYPVAGVSQLPAASCGGGFCGGTLFNPNGTQSPPQTPTPIQSPPQTPIPIQSPPQTPTPIQSPTQNPPQNPDTLTPPVISPLLNIAQTFTSDAFQDKKQDQVIDTTGAKNSATGGGSAGGPSGNSNGGNQRGGNAGRPPVHVVPPIGLGPLPSGMPPIGETRFPLDEVVMQLGANFTPEQVAALTTKYGLEIISSQTFSLLGRAVYRFRITGGLSVRTAIAGLQSGGATISAQPSYTFSLAQNTTAPASTTSQGAPTPPAQGQGDSAQYIVAKLGLTEAQSIATGKGVKIAVIDSEIDAQHPDLQGIVAGSFDALPSSDQTPHSHGTGMAGAIGSHQRLLGIAPGARILGIRAFGVSSEGAQGTSMNIVKGLEWAVKEGAQIINMSFAGPRDPILEQALKSLKDRGIILVGAAGNAGPKSPPLFPGADKNVIGVSATDQDDKTYKGANRGPQVALAAPGVDILVPAPEGGYQLTTGTSVAAAEISGVIALMLERNPQLAPNDVRNILAATARRLPQGRNEVGAGLVDPVQALAKSGPKQALAR